MNSILRLVLSIIILTTIRVHVGCMSFESNSFDKLPERKSELFHGENSRIADAELETETLDNLESDGLDSLANTEPMEQEEEKESGFNQLLKDQALNICLGLLFGVILLAAVIHSIVSCIPSCRKSDDTIESEAESIQETYTNQPEPEEEVRMPRILERVIRGGSDDGAVFITVLNVPKDKMKNPPPQ